MSQGKTIRLKRLIEPQYGSCIICALDHGMTSPNFLDGLYDTRKRGRPSRGAQTSLCLGAASRGRSWTSLPPRPRWR